MSMALDDLLALYAMDLLDAEERAEVERHLAADPDARRALARCLDDLNALPLSLDPVAPPADGLARLLEATASVSRFDAFAGRVAALIDYTLDQARALLARIDDAASWVPGPCAEATLIHFGGGPKLADALVGFVKVQAGAPFPEHTHLGSEIVLVLQGGLQDEDGTIVRRGQERVMGDGTRHDFVALPGPDLIYLVVLERGVEFDFPFEI